MLVHWLTCQGVHPAFADLGARYPIKSGKLLRVLQRCLSALAHWSPLFGEADYLPLLAFPFVAQFENNALHAFEMLATVLTNWCASWFEFFPNPPLNVLAMVSEHGLHALPPLAARLGLILGIFVTRPTAQ